MNHPKKYLLSFVFLLFACAASFVLWRITVVSAVMRQLEEGGSSFNDDFIPGMGPTSVTIGIHAPGESPILSADECEHLVGELPKLWRLKSLVISDTACPAPAIAAAIERTAIKELRANGTAFDDSCCDAAVNRNTITDLSVRDSVVSVQGLKRLKAMTSLKRLYIGSGSFSDEDFQHLRNELVGVDVKR